MKDCGQFSWHQRECASGCYRPCLALPILQHTLFSSSGWSCWIRSVRLRKSQGRVGLTFYSRAARLVRPPFRNHSREEALAQAPQWVWATSSPEFLRATTTVLNIAHPSLGPRRAAHLQPPDCGGCFLDRAQTSGLATLRRLQPAALGLRYRFRILYSALCPRSSTWVLGPLLLQQHSSHRHSHRPSQHHLNPHRLHLAAPAAIRCARKTSNLVDSASPSPHDDYRRSSFGLDSPAPFLFLISCWIHRPALAPATN